MFLLAKRGEGFEFYVYTAVIKVYFFENVFRTKSKLEISWISNYFRIHQYEDIWAHLRTYSQIWNKVILDGASQAIFQTLPGKRLLLKESIINNMKSIKNPTEIKGMENAHIRDGAIMCDFLAHFEQQVCIEICFLSSKIYEL